MTTPFQEWALRQIPVIQQEATRQGFSISSEWAQGFIERTLIEGLKTDGASDAWFQNSAWTADVSTSK